MLCFLVASIASAPIKLSPDPDVPLETYTLATIIGKDDPEYLFGDKPLKLRQICFCESSLRPSVVSYAGWKLGMGLCGFIPSTWNETIDRITKEETKKSITILPENCKVDIIEEPSATHPIFNATCNAIMANWLLAKDGDRHWNSSKSCWEN